MGGKGSAPPPPDYVGAAKEQAELSKELTTQQTWANRPQINTPFGTQSWSSQAGTDPATGQTVNYWTQNTTLAPGLQSALNNQIGLQNDRSALAAGFMGRVANEYGQPFDYANLPQMAEANMPGSLQTGLADYAPGLSTGVNSRSGQIVGGFNFGGPQMSVASGIGGMAGGVGTEALQRGLYTGDNPALPQFDSSYRDTVAQSLMERMVPLHDRQQNQLETQLANQGFTLGSEGYKRALDEMQQRQAGERFNALDMAGQEAQRLYNMQMGSRQQAFNEDMNSGQFFNSAANQAFNQNLNAAQFQNQAANQAFGQNLSAANFGNQAQQQLYAQMMGQANLANQAAGQQFNQDLQGAQFRNQSLGQASALDMQRMQAMNAAQQQQFGLNQQWANQRNQLRQQAIAEQMQRRGMSLNEMNALLSGQQVAMPNMPSFSQAQRSETPNILGATGQQYDAALGAYNAQQAGSSNLLGGLFSLGSSALMGPAGGLFGFGR